MESSAIIPSRDFLSSVEVSLEMFCSQISLSLSLALALALSLSLSLSLSLARSLYAGRNIS